MKKTILIAVALVFTVSSFAFSGTPNSSYTQEILQIDLSINAPFSVAKLSIEKNYQLEGLKVIMQYKAESPDSGINLIDEWKEISMEDFDALAQMVRDADFWSLNKEYIEENLEDATGYTLGVKSVIKDDKRHLRDAGYDTVRCYGICPDQISQIIDKIKELWGKNILEVGLGLGL